MVAQSCCCKRVPARPNVAVACASVRVHKMPRTRIHSAAPGAIAKAAFELRHALDKFEELVAPSKVSAVKTASIDDYISKRRLERDRKPGSVVSPHTLKKELSAIRLEGCDRQEVRLVPSR